jgi:hypothetical protein
LMHYYDAGLHGKSHSHQSFHSSSVGLGFTARN